MTDVLPRVAADWFYDPAQQRLAFDFVTADSPGFRSDVIELCAQYGGEQAIAFIKSQTNCQAVRDLMAAATWYVVRDEFLPVCGEVING